MRIEAGDERVYGNPSAGALRKLRGLVSMHWMLTGDSLQSLGPEETAKILAQIRERLQTRFKLGGL